MMDFLKGLAGEATIAVIAAVSIFVGGYWLGSSLAAARGEAALNSLKAKQAEKDRALAAAHAKAMDEALAGYRAEVARGDGLAADLSRTRQQSQKDMQSLRRQISDATKSSTHTFSPEFVRLYNQAIGIPANALSAPVCASGAPGAAGGSAAADSGVLCGVSEADVLAHITYYGGRCRDFEARQRAWIDLAGGWKGEPK